ncbi:hypothetical protein ACPOL_2274 [Acidisarcina polymorpha]|uniref:Uncharacterized protein n=1 Tax=Acidisarcina polymorpha TaxID=2211140 RepID=A0A2Z5FXI5_9BACT|nr:hypothetical protein ACPOL_2274 [Acidisarcina polymorpha]
MEFQTGLRKEDLFGGVILNAGAVGVCSSWTRSSGACVVVLAVRYPTWMEVWGGWIRLRLWLPRSFASFGRSG